MEHTQILYAVDDGIATITLHRPEKLNAFTNTMMRELLDAFDMVDADDDVRVAIVTGSGRGFCTGPTSVGAATRSPVVEAMSAAACPAFREMAVDWSR